MVKNLARPKQKKLLSAAVRLFRQKGYHATSMQDLAEAVGIQRGSLYHYIEGKEDLLWEIMDRTMAQLFGAVEPAARSAASAGERLTRAVAAHLEVAAVLPDELTILHVELKSLSPERRTRMLELRDRYEAVFRAIVRDGVARDEFRRIHPKAAVLAVLGACNWFTQWFRASGQLSHEAFAAAFADLFLKGLTEPVEGYAKGRGA